MYPCEYARVQLHSGQGQNWPANGKETAHMLSHLYSLPVWRAPSETLVMLRV